MSKTADAFRTISEVATELDLPQHVLRFWETRFSQISPMKRGGGRRYYRPEDVMLLRGIRYLLYGKGYTIKGVQKILQEQGIRFVMDVWREAVTTPVGNLDSLDVAQEESDAYETSELNTQNDLFELDRRAAKEVPVKLPEGVLSDVEELPANEPASPSTGIFSRFRGQERAETGGVVLTKDDVSRLQAVMTDLLECKRLLDRAE
ncbi:MerR family transcriptional regulator [Polycladidibacter stylochi]|uniref:MerR family transcriptional regulator n=1 Tax=Polycladidibacter stylochi TaxID=1807766 RepID=UPI0009EC0589|nr:MerR family transcriptional regulator [Pseudovibrio stylochi]